MDRSVLLTCLAIRRERRGRTALTPPMPHDPSIARPTREDVLDWTENHGRSGLEISYLLSAGTAVAIVLAGIWRFLA